VANVAGGNIAAGLSLIVSALIIHLMVAFMVSEGANAGTSIAGCSAGQNATQCQNTSGTSFLTALLDITFSGFSGVLIVDALYLLVVAGAFITGIILFVAGIVGTPFGGG
jgi:hypothetical protein